MPHTIGDQSEKPPRYWFPAKRYGWGWGLPRTWEGWFTFLVFIFVQCVIPCFINPGQQTLLYVSLVVGTTGVLLLICWKKGEPPRWRWGT
ncbi:MAG: hypothetical protein ABGW78_07775 [Pirellulales bacterium]